MSPEIIAQLILQFGLPLARSIYTALMKTGGPTDADWDALTQLAANRAIDKMKATLVANGIALDSPQGVALLALVQ